MPIPEPKFDGRSYQEILNETLARVPVHTPEYNHLGDSDPGVTILQLFSFIAESVVFRANLIPGRNRRKFLRLLGESPRAAEAARGLVAFANPKGPAAIRTLKRNIQLAAGNVPFRTRGGLQVLPVDMRAYYKNPLDDERQAAVETTYKRLYASFEQVHPEPFVFYETRVFGTPAAGVTMPVINLSSTELGGSSRDTIDGCLWLALLVRKGDRSSVSTIRGVIANQVLTLGILPALGQEGCTLSPEGTSTDPEAPRLVFEIPNTEEAPGYMPLKSTTDEDLLLRPGTVELQLPGADELRYWDDLEPLESGLGAYPPSLEETDDADRLITWIRIRVTGPAQGLNNGSSQMTARLSWVGINASMVDQRAKVPAERLPTGSGEPDQKATLANIPVLLDSARITVNGEPWARMEDLNAAPPEIPPRAPRLASEALADKSGSTVIGDKNSPRSGKTDSPKVFALDRESGEVTFGDGIRGARPPFGATIQASYDFGGGTQGNVGIRAIKAYDASLPAGIEASNPVPTWGGSERESLAEAEKRIPAFLRHGDRLVTASDCEDITWRTPGVELGRVEVLPATHPTLGATSGSVTILVLPKKDPDHPDAPLPDRLFLETICQYLEPRRILTTELHVRGSDYVPVWVSVAIEPLPGVADGPVREEVQRAVKRFLSPLEGGFESKGWPLRKSVEAKEIIAAITRESRVAQVNELLLADSTGSNVGEVLMKGLQLPRLANLEVQSSTTAVPLDEVMGTVDAIEEEVSGFLPVPVIPESC